MAYITPGDTNSTEQEREGSGVTSHMLPSMSCLSLEWKPQPQQQKQQQKQHHQHRAMAADAPVVLEKVLAQKIHWAAREKKTVDVAVLITTRSHSGEHSSQQSATEYYIGITVHLASTVAFDKPLQFPLPKEANMLKRGPSFSPEIAQDKLFWDSVRIALNDIRNALSLVLSDDVVTAESQTAQPLQMSSSYLLLPLPDRGKIMPMIEFKCCLMMTPQQWASYEETLVRRIKSFFETRKLLAKFVIWQMVLVPIYGAFIVHENAQKQKEINALRLNDDSSRIVPYEHAPVVSHGEDPRKYAKSIGEAHHDTSIYRDESNTSFVLRIEYAEPPKNLSPYMHMELNPSSDEMNRKRKTTAQGVHLVPDETLVSVTEKEIQRYPPDPDIVVTVPDVQRVTTTRLGEYLITKRLLISLHHRSYGRYYAYHEVEDESVTLEGPWAVYKNSETLDEAFALAKFMKLNAPSNTVGEDKFTENVMQQLLREIQTGRIGRSRNPTEHAELLLKIVSNSDDLPLIYEGNIAPTD